MRFESEDGFLLWVSCMKFQRNYYTGYCNELNIRPLAALFESARHIALVLSSTIRP